jgi:Spy/CpxP family protein refolding chaperone
MRANRNYFWTLAFLLAALISPVAPPAAQNPGGGYGGGQGRGGPRGPMTPAEELKRLTKALDLTADQQSKIKLILVDQRKKMEGVKNDTSIDRPTMRQKMMKIRKDTNDQIRAVLDDKQKEKFDNQEQEREDRMQNRRGGAPGGPGGDNSGGNPPPPPQN